MARLREEPASVFECHFVIYVCECVFPPASMGAWVKAQPALFYVVPEALFHSVWTPRPSVGFRFCGHTGSVKIKLDMQWNTWISPYKTSLSITLGSCTSLSIFQKYSSRHYPPFVCVPDGSRCGVSAVSPRIIGPGCNHTVCNSSRASAAARHPHHLLPVQYATADSQIHPQSRNHSGAVDTFLLHSQ